MTKNAVLKIEDFIGKLLIAYGGLNIVQSCQGVLYEIEIPKELQLEDEE